MPTNTFSKDVVQLLGLRQSYLRRSSKKLTFFSSFCSDLNGVAPSKSFHQLDLLAAWEKRPRMRFLHTGGGRIFSSRDRHNPDFEIKRAREREREREKRETERQRESSKRSGASLIREEKRRREQIASTPSSSSSSLVRLIPPLVWSPLSQIKLSFTSSSHIHIYVT